MVFSTHKLFVTVAVGSGLNDKCVTTDAVRYNPMQLAQ